jgi:MFS family permease
MWVAGLATVNDVIPSHQFGKVMGILSVAVSVGTSAAPVFAGILLERSGYWTAWSIPFALLLADIAMRLLMVERRKCELPSNLSLDLASSTQTALASSFNRLNAHGPSRITRRIH